jgi:acyl carrier protein
MFLSERSNRTDARVLSLLREVLPWQFSRRDIRPEMSLQSDLGLDSLAKLALMFRFEEEFGVDVANSSVDVTTVQTVQDLLATAQELIQSGGGERVDG